MPWICCEGLDKTGKSTLAKIYKEKGFIVHHMSAPNKKYSEPGYAGPSYLDEMIDTYMKYDGKNVFFDRTIYGELIWPQVYGRNPQLSEADYEVLKEFESRNSTQKILMFDPDKEAHWQRCVENNESISFREFNIASTLFMKLAHNEQFIPMELKDFKNEFDEAEKRETPRETDSIPTQKEQNDKRGSDSNQNNSPSLVIDSASKSDIAIKTRQGKTAEQCKLEKANAINKVLSSKIVKFKGTAFEEIEEEIRVFLNSELSTIMGKNTNSNDFSKNEIVLLKTLCKQWTKKMQN